METISSLYCPNAAESPTRHHHGLRMNEQGPQSSSQTITKDAETGSKPRKPMSVMDQLLSGIAIGIGMWFVYFFITQTGDNFDHATTGLQSLAASLASR